MARSDSVTNTETGQESRDLEVLPTGVADVDYGESGGADGAGQTERNSKTANMDTEVGEAAATWWPPS